MSPTHPVNTSRKIRYVPRNVSESGRFGGGSALLDPPPVDRSEACATGLTGRKVLTRWRFSLASVQSAIRNTIEISNGLHVSWTVMSHRIVRFSFTVYSCAPYRSDC